MELLGQVGMHQVNVEDFEVEDPVVRTEELQAANADCKVATRS
jgi:hypothetical protein